MDVRDIAAQEHWTTHYDPKHENFNKAKEASAKAASRPGASSLNDHFVAAYHNAGSYAEDGLEEGLNEVVSQAKGLDFEPKTFRENVLKSLNTYRGEPGKPSNLTLSDAQYTNILTASLVHHLHMETLDNPAEFEIVRNLLLAGARTTGLYGDTPLHELYGKNAHKNEDVLKMLKEVHEAETEGYLSKFRVAHGLAVFTALGAAGVGGIPAALGTTAISVAGVAAWPVVLGGAAAILIGTGLYHASGWGRDSRRKAVLDNFKKSEPAVAPLPRGLRTSTIQEGILEGDKGSNLLARWDNAPSGGRGAVEALAAAPAAPSWDSSSMLVQQQNGKTYRHAIDNNTRRRQWVKEVPPGWREGDGFRDGPTGGKVYS